jgi:hypothetical protein
VGEGARAYIHIYSGLATAGVVRSRLPPKSARTSSGGEPTRCAADAAAAGIADAAAAVDDVR